MDFNPAAMPLSLANGDFHACFHHSFECCLGDA